MGSGVRRRRHHDSSGWAFISHTPESKFPLSSNRCVFHNFALTPVGRSERVESALRLQHCQAQSSDPRLARLCCCQASLLIDGSPFGCPAGRSAGRLGAWPPGHLAAQLPGRPAARQAVQPCGSSAAWPAAWPSSRPAFQPPSRPGAWPPGHSAAQPPGWPPGRPAFWPPGWSPGWSPGWPPGWTPGWPPGWPPGRPPGLAAARPPGRLAERPSSIPVPYQFHTSSIPVPNPVPNRLLIVFYSFRASGVSQEGNSNYSNL